MDNRPRISTAAGAPHVMHVIAGINRGGAENHLVELIQGQRSRGWDVSVAYLHGDGHWTNHLRGLGAKVYPLGMRRYGDPAPVFRLYRQLRRVRPQLVHAHLPGGELYARLALLLAGRNIAFIISKHNDEPLYPGPGWKLLARWIARRASCVIAISAAVNAFVVRNLRLPEVRVVTVHYAIDVTPYTRITVEERERCRAAFEVPPGGWLIGTVARLAPQKALHVLLEGYARYRAAASRASRLVVVGVGPLREALHAKARDLGIAEHVVWAGYRTDIPQVISAFDAFALTSVYEGFGLVLLEAMAASRPIVATGVSAIPEIVIDGVTGMLIAAGVSDELAGALKTLENPGLRARLGEAGRHRAEETFTCARMVERTEGIYRTSLRTTGLPRAIEERPQD